MNSISKDKKNNSTMTQLKTRSLGTVDVDPDTFIKFPEGLFGFIKYTEFVLLPDPGDFPFEWLQSTQSEDLAFILIEPNEIFSATFYPEASLPDLNHLNIKSVKECKVYTIVTIPQDHPEEMTTNFQGPILVNDEIKTGRQIISLNEDHLLRVKIMDLLEP